MQVKSDPGKAGETGSQEAPAFLYLSWDTCLADYGPLVAFAAEVFTQHVAHLGLNAIWAIIITMLILQLAGSVVYVICHNPKKMSQLEQKVDRHQVLTEKEMRMLACERTDRFAARMALLLSILLSWSCALIWISLKCFTFY